MKVAEIRDLYIKYLLDRDRKSAIDLIKQAIEDKIDFQDLHLNVFQSAQWKIGELWMDGEITVAHEHFCTAVTQLCMTLVYASAIERPRNGLTFLGFCIAGELHDVGLKMILDFMEYDGWDTISLGANVPTQDLRDAIETHEPDVVGISVAMPSGFPEVKEAIEVIHASGNHPPVLVGGQAFYNMPDLWKSLGADGFSPHADSLARVAGTLVTRKK